MADDFRDTPHTHQQRLSSHLAHSSSSQSLRATPTSRPRVQRRTGRPPSTASVNASSVAHLPPPPRGYRAHYEQLTLVSNVEIGEASEYEQRPTTIPSCNLCGCIDIVERSPQDLHELRSRPVDVVLSVAVALGETIGSLLVKTFDRQRRYLGVASRTSVAAFLGGRTREGTHPQDVVDAMYQHPFGKKFNSTGQVVPPVHNLPSYSHPQPSPLEAAFLQLTTPDASSAQNIGYTNQSPVLPTPVRPTPTPSPFPKPSPSSSSPTSTSPSASDSEFSSTSSPSEQSDRIHSPPSPSPSLNDIDIEVPAEWLPQHPVYTGAHASLESWAVSATQAVVNREASLLAKTTVLRSAVSGLSWDFVLNFSMERIQSTAMAVAPVLWSLVTTAAIGSWRRKKLEKARQSDQELREELLGRISRKDKKGRRMNPRNPWLGCTIAIALLIFFRHHECNAVQSVIGLFLFSTRASSAVFSILGRGGVSVAYSTTMSRLHRLGKSSAQRLESIGERASNHAEYFLLLYDNINKQRKAWRQTVGTKSQVKSGTAATAVILEDIEPGAFDPGPYHAKLAAGDRKNLTVEALLDDLDEQHLASVTATNIAMIMTKHIPALSHHAKSLSERLRGTLSKFRLRLRKSRYFPMSTSNLDEATTVGNIKILADLALGQMKMVKEAFKSLLVMVCGDQMTISRLRSAMLYTSDNIGPDYDRHTWVLPIIQLWHLKWAFLKGLVRCHWAPDAGKRLFGLRRNAEGLGRKINPDVCDFYPTHRLVEITYESMVLHCVRLILREDLSPTAPQPAVNLTLLEELAYHFGPYGQWSADVFATNELLALARRVEQRFVTNAAVQASLGSAPRPAHIYGADIIAQQEPDYEPMELRPTPDDNESEAGSERIPNEDPPPINDVKNDDDDEPRDEPLPEQQEDPDHWTGDRALWNTTLFMVHASWYYELSTSMSDGDIGRVAEVLKLLRFYFWGCGSTNYGTELLHLACGFLFEYPDKLKNAILNNWLINPSGLPGGWYPLDLLQEHLNFWIKRVFPDKDTDFDSDFLREAVSLNINSFGNLQEHLSEAFGLFHGGSRRSKDMVNADINLLGRHFLEENTHIFISGRRQSFHACDAFIEGFQKLESNALRSFLDRV